MSKSSRKSKGAQDKRQKFVDPQGWTHVVRGPKLGLAHPRLETAVDRFSISSSPDVIDLHQTLQRYHRIWSSSPACDKLLTLMEQNVLPAVDTTIHKCVCLGLGSLSDGRESSRFQFATLSTMLQLLNQKSKLDQVVFQDPAFTPSDIEFLESQNHTVVASPAAFDLVDQHTFLFAPHLEHQHYAKAVEKQVPAITIGSDVDVLLGGTFTQNDRQVGISDMETILQRFSEGTECHPMPDLGQDPWCLFTTLYWRSHHAVTGYVSNEPAVSEHVSRVMEY